MTSVVAIDNLIQHALVAALMTWSLWRFLRALVPSLMRNLQNRLAQTVSKAGWPRLGSWMQSGEAGAGCGSGCNTCGSCSTPAKTQETLPPALVQWRTHHKE